MKASELSLRDIQIESLNILKRIDEICRKEGINYYLAYGTLIGAVRHNGIIPWDDDIDIMMPRPDYDRLERYFIQNKDELLRLRIFSPNEDEKYPYMINRISNCDYIVDTENEESYGLGVFIDIYPLDAMGNSLREAEKMKSKGCRYASMCFLSTRLKLVMGTTKTSIKRALKIPAYYLARMLGKDYFFERLRQLAKQQDYESANYVGCLVWAADDGRKGVFKKEWFGNGQLHEFEGMMFMIPDNYDCILKRLYGDYMTPPPSDECIGHHFYRVYRRDYNA